MPDLSKTSEEDIFTVPDPRFRDENKQLKLPIGGTESITVGSKMDIVDDRDNRRKTTRGALNLHRLSLKWLILFLRDPNHPEFVARIINYGEKGSEGLIRKNLLNRLEKYAPVFVDLIPAIGRFETASCKWRKVETHSGEKKLFLRIISNQHGRKYGRGKYTYPCQIIPLIEPVKVSVMGGSTDDD